LFFFLSAITFYLKCILVVFSLETLITVCHFIFIKTAAQSGRDGLVQAAATKSGACLNNWQF
jgi:hypothetical protein